MLTAAGRDVRAVAIATVVGLIACGGEHAPTETRAPDPVVAALGGTTVARVGTFSVDRSLVVTVARAQHVPASLALQHLVDDVLLAEAAKKQRPYDDPGVRLAEASTLARSLLTRLRVSSLATPFTDQEISAMLPGYWVELERPEMRLVIHALVDKTTSNAAEIARTLQKDLADANGETPEKSEAQFGARAKALKLNPALRIEKFAIVADGRFAKVNGGVVLDEFTKGAFAIPQVLGTSDVVQTEYGFHVIRLLAKEPPLTATREEKLAKMHTDLVAARVRVAHEDLLKKLHEGAKVSIVATDNDLLLPR